MGFCKFCGSPLADGQICGCPEAQAAARGFQPPQPQYPPQGQPQYPPQGQPPYPPQGQPQYPPQGQPQYPPQGQPQYPPQGQPQYPPQGQYYPPQGQYPGQYPMQPKQDGAFVKSFKAMGPFFKAYWTRPTEGIRLAVEQNSWLMCLWFSIIRVFLASLAVYGVMRKTVSTIVKAAFGAVTGAMGGLGDMYGMSSMANMLMAKLKVPFFSTFFCGVLAAVICTTLFLLMVWALSKIHKGRAGFVAVYEACTANSILPTALFLLAFLASFASSTLGSLLIGFAFLAWIIMGVLTAQFLCPNNDRGVFWLLYFVGVILVYVIGMVLAILCMLPAIGSFVGNIVSLVTDGGSLLNHLF